MQPYSAEANLYRGRKVHVLQVNNIQAPGKLRLHPFELMGLSMPGRVSKPCYIQIELSSW